MNQAVNGLIIELLKSPIVLVLFLIGLGYVFFEIISKLRHQKSNKKKH